ncbi:T-cell surface glycoprotein CD4-like [Oreochromis aureus]|uniref:T-cell surface glycoprotein CD4-like n=1 Tax=Oreochromis aureus TaxID=47969 RepID=UPI001952A640|nr:T-cell surface glycoprotein CD4-like [Oreochromis aureus]
MNRVDLQDRQMKDGDVSLILKDVTINDTGRYECRVVQRVGGPMTLISIIHLHVVPPEKKTIKVKSGQDVTLTCRASNNKIKSVHWSRADLTDGYVLLYQDGQFVPDHQHPSFKNRVDLQDRQMKDGDVSLILNNVKINDAGTYECRVFIEETRSWKNSIIIHLTVVDPPGE